ncbi:tripartite tricarboxylate transporter TctB family protein [Paracoccus onubensis]|uniref:Tripartite tricarboxylate transporter TctB family protein n=1 Tax=Paracoccus onubensis TaxID=1675788 RepID=A0A418SMH0_9RHOB|nr:tripartite tricarboxylate transporter TctB family protein [Paracoccus onubensis]RJE82134.1 tripartite tricarboxylate transporter TctB family protein [Paracoccus onubensis]
MQRDYHDILWGGFLSLLGLAVAVYSATHYDIGNLRRMGPGFFPVSLGAVLALLGVVIAIPALWRAGETRSFAGRELLGIIVALLLFALLMNRVGIVVTAAAVSFVASAVAPRPGIVWRLVLAAVIAGLTWAVFIEALEMAIPVWPWSR